MTRGEQLWDEATDRYGLLTQRYAWVNGAKWADSHPQWIPVEEELPEVGEKVIFYSPDLDDWLSGAIQSDGRWWSEEYTSHFTNVPLWMKPQIPRKEE